MSIPYKSLSENFAVSPQLTAEDMQAVAAAGFKSVIINRPDFEGGAEQPLAADVMAAAEAVGLQACYQPVAGNAITAADVNNFADLLETLPQPVLAYCRSGNRCSILYHATQTN
ncbi:TIGR01244 family sulfur transferase [Alcaligenes endophyticus]|uniref:TIGR01244 family phosphatase n=1 Tax=Alcaligenes endophyticus TaxID=1929088 RepID=A0ABT8EGT1_9BURK|nr:TIGR01244 family sulfur transferase [Alcaligenes endophyticus]MCX5589843.1 TIGR01244 family sulfur transferase [Alcaligenes endophyticus]MDN4120494.1 TIGR01244 family phosphatase [Alcaligenes endophyticus]